MSHVTDEAACTAPVVARSTWSSAQLERWFTAGGSESNDPRIANWWFRGVASVACMEFPPVVLQSVRHWLDLLTKMEVRGLQAHLEVNTKTESQRLELQ